MATLSKRGKKLLHRTIRRFGVDVVRVAPPPLPYDVGDADRRIIEFVRPYTMTPPGRIIALIEAVRYIVGSNLEGAMAECGVWRGGSMMAVAATLRSEGDHLRELYLFDTFSGMPEPGDEDVSWDGETAAARLARTPRGTGVWCHAGLEEVRASMFSTGYPESRIHFVDGRVEDTIPRVLPGKLSLLRLDTDWYASTKHEMIHLFPLLQPGGILIVDDYGHWRGARKALDEYFAECGITPYMHRVDETARVMVKR